MFYSTVMKKNMKPIILFLIIFLIGACQTDRIEVASTHPTELDFFRSTDEFRQAVYSIYAQPINLYAISNEQIGFGGARNISDVYYLPGDDITETRNIRKESDLFSLGLNPDYSRSSSVWSVLYAIIQRSNVILEKVNTVDWSEFEGAEEIPNIEGEALTFRAWAYYMLFTNWGDVPLITERIRGSGGISPSRTSGLDILNKIIEDLESSVIISANSWTGEQRGRFTVNSARSLLVKSLVTRASYFGTNEDYTRALTVFEGITNELLTDYSDNFNAFTENNNEAAIEFQAGHSQAVGGIFLPNTGPWRGTEALGYFRLHSVANAGGNEWAADTKFIITEKLRNIAQSDPRIAFWVSPIFEGLVLEKYTKDGYDFLPRVGFESGNNERVLRYADVKLLVAEAALKSGQPALAISHINDVRNRANVWGATLVDGVDYNSSNTGLLVLPEPRNISETNENVIMSWIQEERFIELAGEGHRWDDLKRWQVSGDINITNWGGDINGFSVFSQRSNFEFDISKHLLLPLPQQELDLNDGINKNNPGYEEEEG